MITAAGFPVVGHGPCGAGPALPMLRAGSPQMYGALTGISLALAGFFTPAGCRWVPDDAHVQGAVFADGARASIPVVRSGSLRSCSMEGGRLFHDRVRRGGESRHGPARIANRCGSEARLVPASAEGGGRATDRRNGQRRRRECRQRALSPPCVAAE